MIVFYDTANGDLATWLNGGGLPANTSELVFTASTICEGNIDLTSGGLILPDLILTFQGQGTLVNNTTTNCIITGERNLIKAENGQILSTHLDLTGSWINSRVSTSWFGALGGLGVDEDPFIQKAINFAALIGAEEVFLSDGVHQFGNTIRIRTSNIRLIGESQANTRLEWNTAAPFQFYGVDIQGEIIPPAGSTGSLMVDANLGDLTLTIPPFVAGTFKKDDYLLLRSNEHYDPSYAIDRAEMVQLRDDGDPVSGVLNLRAPIVNSYTIVGAFNPRVEKFKMLENVTVENLTVDMRELSGATAIHFNAVINSAIRGCTILGTPESGIEMRNVTQFTCENNSVFDTIQNGQGYGISTSNTSNYVTIQNNSIKRSRHCVSFGAGGGSNGYGAPMFCNVLGNYAEGDTIGSGLVLDTHPFSYHISFIGNTVRYGATAFNARGKNLLFANNEVSGTFGYGIKCHASSDSVRIDSNVISRCGSSNNGGAIEVNTNQPFVISNNEIDQTGVNKAAIFISAKPYSGTGPTVSRKIITGNNIVTAKSGITSNGLAFKDLIISDNNISYKDSGFGGSPFGINFIRSSSDPLAGLENDLIVSNNQIHGFVTAISIGEGAKGWQILGNVISGPTYGIIPGTHSKGIAIRNNIFDVTIPILVASASPGVSHYSITGNEFKNFTGNRGAIKGFFTHTLIEGNYAHDGTYCFINWDGDNPGLTIEAHNKVVNNRIEEGGGQIPNVFRTNGKLEANSYLENDFEGYLPQNVFHPDPNDYEKGRIQWNTGFTSESKGKANVIDLAFQVQVAHGLDKLPLIEDISVTPSSKLFNADNFYIDNVTNTHFTINLNAAPGVGNNVSFVWQANL